jgi:acetylornithine deacetylase
MDDLTALLQDLVRIPSVSPSLAPGEGQGEQAVAEFAVNWLRERGVEAALEPVAPGRPNAVGRLGNGRGPTLVLYGHLDTVQASNMTIPPFEPRIDGDRLYGRGSADMKGGVAAVMAAAAALAREGGVAGTLLLALVCDEEYSSIGAQAFVEQHRADGCILAEPTNGALITGHRGYAWIDVIVAGRAAHGSLWQVGISANARAGRLLVALDEFDRTTLRQRRHPLLGPASLHPAVVQGGVGLSTYAPECTIRLERRSLPGESDEQILQEIRQLVTEAGVEATVTLTLSRPPMICPADARVKAALQTTLGPDVPEQGALYWMDAALFDAAGTPCVVYGPTGDGLHADVEWVDLPSVHRCAAVYQKAAREFFR